jgi:putative toxin-antitoxin system antitoxin component (TIGR02293 family)
MSISNIINSLGGKKIINQEVLNEPQLLDLIQNGLPKSSIKHLSESSGLEMKEILDLLPVTPRNLQRYKDSELLNSTLSDRLIVLADFIEFGKTAFGQSYFTDWLRSPITALGYKKPIEYLNTSKGISYIQTIIGRIQHGIAA